MEKKEIKIFRAGRESLEEAVRLVQSTEEKMKEKSTKTQRCGRKWFFFFGGKNTFCFHTTPHLPTFSEIIQNQRIVFHALKDEDDEEQQQMKEELEVGKPSSRKRPIDGLSLIHI